MISNHKNSSEQRFSRIPSLYSDDLQKMIKFMLSLDHEFRPTIEIILHHPTVVLHVSERCVSKFALNKIYVPNDNFVDETLKNDFKMVSLYDRDPETISENTFKEKWLTRLEAIRRKEAVLRSKEESLVNKERSLIKKEKHLLLLEKLAKEKMLRAEVYLKQCKESKPVTSISSHRLSKPLEEIDTSFSADPGDTSILPTSSKINPSLVHIPDNFIRTTSERKPKHVHFKVPKLGDKNCQHHDLLNPKHVNEKSHRNSMKSTVLQCHNKMVETRKSMLHLGDNSTFETAFMKERAVWLENKRTVYNTAAEKENIHSNVTENVHLTSFATGTMKKKFQRKLNDLLDIS